MQINKESNKKIFSGPKIVFAILGVALLIEVVYAVRVLTSPTPSPPPIRESKVSTESQAGKISLITPKTNYKVAEVVPVSVMIDTGSHTVDGVDLIVRFDPKTLEGSSGGLIKGDIFDEYPLISLDAKAGLISISGISSSGKGFSGTGQFATLNLRAKAPGVASLIIDFKEGSTTDSNLVVTATSEDILGSVSNISLEIR